MNPPGGVSSVRPLQLYVPPACQGLSTRNTVCVLYPAPSALEFCEPIRKTLLAPTGGVCSNDASNLPLVVSVTVNVALHNDCGQLASEHYYTIT